MYIKDYMSEERVFGTLECTSKTDLIGKMVEMIMKSVPTLDKDLATNNLLEKESIFSTGVGGGIAIPHAVVPGVDKTYLSVARLKQGIEYQSIDNELVRIVFMLFSPEKRTREHIKLLARIARICFNHVFVGQMNAAVDGRELFKVIVEEDVRHPD